MTSELSEEERRDRERRVVEAAQRFDLGALMGVLRRLGYRPAQTLFESNSEEAGSEGIIERLCFEGERPRRVRITLNIGLLGRETLLPSYFFSVLRETDHLERFQDFIRYFDDRLLANYVRASYPESHSAAYADWGRAKSHFLNMLGVASVSTLHHFATLIFPELPSRVRRAAFSTSTSAHSFRVGRSTMDGSTVIGQRFEWSPSGFEIDLVTEDELDEGGRSWPSVVKERLDDQLFPHLSPYRIPLSVRLTILDHATWAQIEDEEDQRHGQLGYERIKDHREAPHTILLYRGIVGAEPSGTQHSARLRLSRRTGP